MHCKIQKLEFKMLLYTYAYASIYTMLVGTYVSKYSWVHDHEI